MSKRFFLTVLVACSLAAAPAVRNAAADEMGDRLIEMSTRGRLIEVRFALEQGADPDYRNADGTTSLLEAVRNRWYPVVRLLLDSGADPDIRSDRNDPAITYAAAMGDLDVTQALIEAGADVEARDTDGIEQLTSESGVTALWIAARRGMVDVARVLLEAGADPATHSADGDAAWAVAKGYGHEEIYQMLVDAGGGPAPEPELAPGEGK